MRMKLAPIDIAAISAATAALTAFAVYTQSPRRVHIVPKDQELVAVNSQPDRDENRLTVQQQPSTGRRVPSNPPASDPEISTPTELVSVSGKWRLSMLYDDKAVFTQQESGQELTLELGQKYCEGVGGKAYCVHIDTIDLKQYTVRLVYEGSKGPEYATMSMFH